MTNLFIKRNFLFLPPLSDLCHCFLHKILCDGDEIVNHEWVKTRTSFLHEKWIKLVSSGRTEGSMAFYFKYWRNDWILRWQARDIGEMLRNHKARLHLQFLLWTSGWVINVQMRVNVLRTFVTHLLVHMQFLLWFLVRFSPSDACERVDELRMFGVHVPSSEHS